MKFSILILIVLILASCTIHPDTKVEIKQSIKKLEQQIDQRRKEELQQEQLLQSAWTKYHWPGDTAKISESEQANRMIKFAKVIRPISDRLQELKDRNSIDESKIQELMQELKKLGDRNSFN